MKVGSLRRWRPFGTLLLLSLPLAAPFGAGCGDDAPPTPTCEDDCLQPPPPVCEGDERVTFAAFGECVAGTCVYAPANRTTCADGCDEGACVVPEDLCADVRCETPPEAICGDDDVLTRYDGGACDPDTGACVWEPVERDCAALGDVCRNARCVPPGICETVLCDDPPDDFCRGRFTAVQHGEEGTCDADDGSCEYAENETDCAADGQLCADGRCVDAPPCGGDDCTFVPGPRCEDNEAVAWENGRCDAETDVCVRDEQRVDCSLTDQICVEGACVDDPACVGVTCDAPPAPSCDGSRAIRWATDGACADGECAYEREVEACSEMGMGCRDGECVDASCLGVVCASPPAPSCDGDVARIPEGIGTCDAGDCDYALASVDCSLTDEICRGGACVAPPPCTAGACGDPPGPYCDGGVATRPFGTGLCTDAGCVFGEERVDCALQGETCIDGVCRDACWETTCNAPPPSACEGDTRVAFAETGTCNPTTGSCTYSPRVTNCAATGELCVDGACVPDPCDSLSCDTPPPSTCDGDVEVEAFGAGLCERGACTFAERRRDCTTDGLVCRDGACRDACYGVTCDTPPDAFCEVDVRVSFADAGTCNPATGGCSFAQVFTNCTDTGEVCVDGACVPDPCETTSCDTPPDAFCDGAVEVEPFGAGLCERGVCSWAERRRDCSAEGLSCVDGACRDACFGVSCDAPPAPTCDGDVLLTRSDDGRCTLPDGTCTWDVTPRNCAATGEICLDGACVVDPCVDLTCPDTPAPVCDGQTSVQAVGDAACARGVCSWTEIRRDCSAEGRTCIEGLCRDACFGVDCSDAPPATCDGDTRLARGEGACQLPDGTCAWPTIPEDCANLGLVCIDGACTEDPCPGITCGPPPPAFCDGDVRTRFGEDSTCARGVCSWPEDVLDCASIGTRCEDGECVSLCTGVTCDAPDAPAVCEGDTRLAPADVGTCDPADGSCSYATEATNCAATGGICLDGACVDDPCESLSCDVPPPSFCDGDTEVEAFGAGLCERGVCTFAERRRDCLDEGLFCVDGACRDACYGVACDDPPESFCEEDNLVGPGIGTCQPDTGTCTWTTEAVDCAATGELCLDGACVTDPCDPRDCLSVPEPFCDGNTEVEPLDVGTCERGVCTRPERRRDCSADGLTCIDGACRDACYGVDCGPTPAATCDDETLLTSVGEGICDPATGTCSWTLTAEDCTSSDAICLEGACVPDPCAGESCLAGPDSAFCDGESVVARISPGTCVRETGACTYETTTTDCAAAGLRCSEGACVDLCEGVTCGSAPAPVCDGRTRITYSGEGTCRLSDGTCAWETVATDCGDVGQRCVDGACVEDPCFDVVCDVVPEPTCDGDTLRSPVSGVCSPATGTCVWDEALLDCSAAGGSCVDGACQDACFGVTCDDPPEPSCVGDVRVTRSAPGVCEEGTCAYEDIFENCLDDGRVCRAGVCVVPDECDGITCETPPAPLCDGNVLVVADAEGTCEDRICTYPTTTVDCGATGRFCVGDACVEDDPCSSFDCDAPPAPFCDGADLVRFEFSGTCNLAGCVWDEVAEPCADGTFCEDGACRGPCDGVSCDTPPPALCRGNIANTFGGPAECVLGGCDWTITETDCAAVGQFCAGGACVAADPCEGVVCDTPPEPACAGSLVLTFTSGTCEGGACVWISEPTDCAATGEVCEAGACVADACTGLACDTPPAPECLSATVSRSYFLPSSCTAGVCSYTATTDDCGATGGLCADGVCISAPNCLGTVCDEPPAPFCDLATNTAVRPIAFAGCVGATCDWLEDTEDCDEDGGFCVDGACASLDPCADVVCNTPPAATCADNRTVVWEPTGVCLGGVCEYATAEGEDCAATGRFCDNGVCTTVDPCAGVTCDAPPAPTCDGNVRLDSLEGICSSGLCSYAIVPTNCALGGQICEAGACVDPPSCEVAGCTTPPVDTCLDELRVQAWTADGTCTPDGCVYSSVEVDCSDFDLVCARGECAPPAARIDTGELVITEFLPGPNGWIEIHNTSGRSLDLQGLALLSDRSARVFETTQILPADAWFVVGSTTSALPGGPDASWGDGFELATTGSNITLSTGARVIDEVVYGASWPFAASASAQLSSDAIDAEQNDLRDNWCTSTSDYAPGAQGTPGGANFLCD